jgi:hypothetical protein
MWYVLGEEHLERPLEAHHREELFTSKGKSL